MRAPTANNLTNKNDPKELEIDKKPIDEFNIGKQIANINNNLNDKIKFELNKLKTTKDDIKEVADLLKMPSKKLH